MKNRLDEDYRGILGELVCNGREKGDRTGTGTLSKFGMQIKHDMSEGFPLLTTKRMPIKTIMTELKWFLKGDTNIKYLVENGCNIWNGDAYENYLKGGHIKWLKSFGIPYSKDEFVGKIKNDNEFAEKWGDLGPIYGKQWRSWKTEQFDYKPVAGHPNRMSASNFRYVDQIQNLINNIKSNPDSRRLMVNAWNVGELDNMTLPPCHYGFQVYTRELSDDEKWEQYIKSGLNIEINGTPLELKHMGTPFYPKSLPQRAISLMWNQRSVDTFLGLPFNIASYGMLLLLLCEEVGLKPGELIGNFGDTHLYKNHIEQAKEQISRDSFDLPTIKLSNVDVLNGEFDYELNNYKHHPTIKAPLSN